MVRITVVNESRELLDLIGEILAGYRYKTTLIEGGGADVLRQVCQSDPDLLIIDLRHGDDALYGWDFVRELRHTPGCEDLPVLLSSTDLGALSQVTPDVDEAGRVLTLQTPFGIDELIQSIDGLVDGRADAATSPA
jgi:CheY-like chemotaxis protein